MEQQFSATDIEGAAGTSSVSYLGTGTFGETWRVVTGGKDAAYKIIYRDDADLERLRREIESYRRVASENVVRLDNVMYLEIAGKRRANLVFEYIEGGDLAEAIPNGRPTGDQLVNLASGLLQGISAIHAANLLHRDLKPANIALRRGDYSHPVVLDLGLAKLMDVESITRYPQAIGTPMYMAPEQLRGDRALKASDLWAVGVVLYEAATGTHPYVAPGETLSWDTFFERIKNKPALPEHVPVTVSDLIDRCLSEQPHKRGTVAKAILRIKGE
ncbi:serine/threonine-protein kinase [Streptomyces sp. NBC_01306]|uniref:serine/threonine-protein kinase n=1 Tax=Streptomyces sp. NBC_01306 TaxID=2903819 RepID=UPI00224D6C19|nr:serine/threonine-protein kinase [Streptomyces sp. NBC_01306]MCX4726975.1 serine/threonine protein kinase [Streptomyces sp. NBC_01306]